MVALAGAFLVYVHRPKGPGQGRGRFRWASYGHLHYTPCRAESKPQFPRVSTAALNEPSSLMLTGPGRSARQPVRAVRSDGDTTAPEVRGIFGVGGVQDKSDRSGLT